MNEALKNFHTQEQIERSRIKVAEKLTVKSKDNLQKDDKKNEKKKIEAFSIDLRKINQTDTFFNQFSYVLCFS